MISTTARPSARPALRPLLIALGAALGLAAVSAPAPAETAAPGDDRPSRADLLLERSWEHLRAARLDSATHYLQRLLRSDPREPRAYRTLLRVYDLGGRHWEGIRYLDSLNRQHAGLRWPVIAMGELELMRGSPARAAVQFEKALTHPQPAPEALAGYARSQVGLGKGEEALDYFTKLIAATPSSSAPHYGKAVALAELGRHRHAASEFKWAFSLDPDNWLAERDYARTLVALDDLELAASHLERAAEILEAAHDAGTAAAIRDELTALPRGPQRPAGG